MERNGTSTTVEAYEPSAKRPIRSAEEVDAESSALREYRTERLARSVGRFVESPYALAEALAAYEEVARKRIATAQRLARAIGRNGIG